MKSTVTLFDLVSAVSDYAKSEAELVATVAHLVNSGRVRLGGHFSGARIDLGRAASPSVELAATA